MARVLNDCETYVQTLNECFTSPDAVNGEPAKTADRTPRTPEGREAAAATRIGVDLGGTEIEAIALDPSGRCVARRCIRPAGPTTTRPSRPSPGWSPTSSPSNRCRDRGDRHPRALSPFNGRFARFQLGVAERAGNRPGSRSDPGARRAHRERRGLLRPLRGHRRGRPRGALLLRRHPRHRLWGRCGGGRAPAGRPYAIAGEWGHNPLPWPAPGPATGTGLLLRQAGLHRDLRLGARPGGGSPPPHRRTPRATAILAAAQAGELAAKATLERHVARLARALGSDQSSTGSDMIDVGRRPLQPAPPLRGSPRPDPGPGSSATG